MTRDVLFYSVGSERNPADPFGRSRLVLQVDGRARLDQHTRAGHSAWTGTVAASALDRLWGALEEASFPAMPKHAVPAGSAIRDLNVGGPNGKSAYIAYHAAATLAGYDTAFRILDTILRQISEGAVKVAPEGGEPIVSAIARCLGESVESAASPVAPRALSPGQAFLLAYLPARRVSHNARRALVNGDPAVDDRALAHAIDFSRAALSIEDSLVDEVDARLNRLARDVGIVLPSSASATKVADVVRPQLTTPVLQAAFKAGEAAYRLAIAVPIAAHIAYLRNAAPDDANLRERAADRARAITASAEALTAALEATGLPFVISLAGVLEEMVKTRDDLQPTTKEGLRELNVLSKDVYDFVDAYAQHLDVPPPQEPTAPATDEENALVAKIIANPGDVRARLALAQIAAVRKDPRAELIRLQLSPSADTQQTAIETLIRSHPEWTEPLVALGARDITFAGGFPDGITVDADVLLTRGRDLLGAAPIRRLKVRAAKGRTPQIVRWSLLGTIVALDLDDQGVTDEDLIALAASPHAAELLRLDLRYNPISARGIEALAASAHLKRLDMVNLDGNPADPVDRCENYDETRSHFVPTEAGMALEAKYGRLPWLRRS